jgi:hypothetical protein
VRVENWQARLWKSLDAANERPFFFGACVQLAAECVDAITGSEWVAAVRALYADEGAARELVKAPGALEELVTERLGPPVARLLGRQGDLMLLELPTGPALGICTGERIACVASPAGVRYLPFAMGLKAWRVD